MFCTYCSSHDKISYNFSSCILILMQSPNTQLQNATCFPLIFIKRHFASVVMLCGFTVNYLMSFLFLKTHLNLIETTYLSCFFFSWPLPSAGRSAARQPERDDGWSLTFLETYVVFCRCNPLLELTWTSPQSFASLSATYAHTRCSKVPTGITHTSHVHRQTS